MGIYFIQPTLYQGEFFLLVRYLVELTKRVRGLFLFSIEFDRDDELFATAGVSRCIKVFDFSSVSSNFLESIHLHTILNQLFQSYALVKRIMHLTV